MGIISRAYQESLMGTEVITAVCTSLFSMKMNAGSYSPSTSQAVRGMLDNPNEPVSDLSYFDCIESVMENSKVGL